MTAGRSPYEEGNSEVHREETSCGTLKECLESKGSELGSFCEPKDRVLRWWGQPVTLVEEEID